jgi:hypothetical protein
VRFRSTLGVWVAVVAVILLAATTLVADAITDVPPARAASHGTR